MPTTIQTISKDQLKREIEQGKVQVVNVLSPEHYHLGAIAGSKKIPLAELDRRANELDKSKPVVTYCAHSECHASMKGAEKLAEMGFNVRAYEGGIKEWKESGLPTDGASPSPQPSAAPSDSPPNAGSIDQPSGLAGAGVNKNAA